VLDEAIKMATDVLAPLNPVGDREGLKYENGNVITPSGFKEAWKKFSEGGWIGMVHDPDLGGQGLPNVLKFLASEIFAGANIAFFLTSMLTEGAAHLIQAFGTDEMRKLYCPNMYTGRWTGTMCLTEPQAGSDVGNLKTSARPNGDHYLISGSKIFISAGEHDLTENIIHPVLARIEGAPKGTKGISLFLVPKYLVNPDGSLAGPNDVRCGGIEHKMGIHASPTCTMNFGDEGNCRGWLLGEPNKGMACMFQMMNEARLGVGIQGLGLASVAYQSALSYAHERTQGASWKAGKDPNAPRVPIIEHPDVRRMLMFMKSLTEGMRALMYSVARHIDLSMHSPDEKERELNKNMVELLTPVCKAYGSDWGFRVNEVAVQVFGGYGYCQEYPVEQYLRDQKISSIYEGTNGIQAIDLIGRKIARNNGEYLRQFVGMMKKVVEPNLDHPRLGSVAQKQNHAIDTVVELTTWLGQAFGKDMAVPLLNACPYLEAFGHMTLGYYLLQGALIADEKLQQLMKQSASQDVAEAAKTNPDVGFYHDRILSARFFANYMLPRVDSIAAAIKTDDRSALEALFGQD
ncbi:MAG: acyl-CoA dehydrogenase, partial [Deltaproteobacteria bacterium]